MRRKPLLLIVLILLTGGFAGSQETAQGTYDDLARQVEKEIREEKKVQIEDLKVLHNSGTIYLQGVSDAFGSHYLAGKAALKVDDVENVVNDIEVKSTDVSNTEIEGEAIRKIRSHLKGSPFDLISIKVNSGFVTLTGNVRDQTLVNDAMESVMWIRGVRGVENKIQHASISAGDDRLRRGIHQRLYREFPQHFVGKDPSIFILVNSGRVRLVGYVESNVTREKIGSIIRSFPGVLSVDNQLQAN
jgi:osmotically-inducible protein OsmY